LAHHQKDFEPAAETHFDMAEVIRALASGERGPVQGSRCAALARFLSGEDRGEALGGAFAKTRLSDGKEI
jgi:hypothetical protein